MNRQNHPLELVTTGPSGAEEWKCPICGRRMVVEWKPKFKKTVLVNGDTDATHTGQKGGLQISMQIKPAETSELEIDDKSLEPWNAWMEQSGFDELWNNTG